MKCVSEVETESPTAPATSEVRLPTGLLGFEQIKDYLLIVNPGEEPFGWLQVRDNPALAFVVLNPFLALPDYQPDIPQPDIDQLGLKSPDDVLLLNIVTVRGPGRATVNLKGPIVINRHTHVGRQVVIANAVEYAVQRPLPVDEAAA